MGTYIIHFDDKPWEDLDDEQYYRCKEIPWFSTTKTTISRLTPCTEPDLDAVHKEAYYKGYETAKHECEDCNANAVKIADDNAHEAYQKGLEDAWDAARTLWNTPNRKEIFGNTTFNTVLTTLTAQETIEKIRQYEQEKEEIKVGDEVIPRETEYDTMIVTRLWKDDCDFNCIDAIGFDGRISSFLVSRVSKTGKHYEIAAVLAKMKES